MNLTTRVFFLLLLGLAPTFSSGQPAAFQQAQWRVRDVVASSSWLAPADAEKVGLKLETPSHSNANWTCVVIDATGGERSVTLALCIPIPSGEWSWWDDPQRTRPAAGEKIIGNLADNAGGMNNEASFYPVAVMSSADRGLCVAIPPDVPRMARFVFDPKLKELRVEFDFGLSPVPEHYKSRADATVIGYDVPPKCAFREALERYYRLYPDAFVRRVKRAGIWFPFNETGKIENAEDFGFGFHEIADSQVADPALGKKLIDDDHRIGCGAYQYTEPQTYWQLFTGQGKRTYDDCLVQLEAQAKAGNKMAQGTLTSGIIRAGGQRDLYLEGVPYTTQLPWGSNADPAIPDDLKSGYPSKANVEFEKMESILGWRGDRSDIGIDGIYVDSSEGWGEILNYNRDHWRVSRYPLTFDPHNHNKVALLNFWGTHAWVKEMARRLHSRGKILMANDAFFRKWQLFPYVDVPGREYAWITRDGKFTPVPDERYLFFRAMAGKRPYCMLMNNDYDRGEFMIAYFQRSLFYAVYPSMYFGHTSANDEWYFANPKYYNRDRQLFKTYVPMIRKLDEAGWEPVPHADVEPKEIRIERYGRMWEGNLAFTLHNTSDRQQKVKLRLLKNGLRLLGGVSATEWIGSRPVLVEDGDEESIPLTFELPAGAYGVIGIETGPGGY